jgi:hypothetical protein
MSQGSTYVKASDQMSSRKYRHPDGIGHKRSARTTEPMAPADVFAWVTETLGDDAYEALMPRGTEIEWYSRMTPEELAEHDRHTLASAARLEKWERETYERLREKYGHE